MLKPRSLLMSSQSDPRKVHHAPLVFSKEISVRTVYPAPSPVPVVLLVSFLSNSLKSARVGDGPGLGVAPRTGIRQALRALATSVKTRRLGLCVVPCDVVRVCGRHPTVSDTETRPRAAGHGRRSELMTCRLHRPDAAASVNPNRNCAVLLWWPTLLHLLLNAWHPERR